MSAQHTPGPQIVPVRNRFSHDENGHPYTFTAAPDGAIHINGMGAETWLCMALTAVECIARGDDRNGGLSLHAAASYIRKGIAAVVNEPDTRAIAKATPRFQPRHNLKGTP